MTLATAILFGIFCATSGNPDWLLAQSASQSTAAEPPRTGAVTKQETPPAPTYEESKTSSDQQAGKPSAAAPPKSNKRKKTHPRKKIDPPNCDPAPGPASAATTGTSAPVASQAAPGTGNAPPQKAGAAPSKNCPPSKIIVRQGGITEQSIQLAGGPGGDQATQKRGTVNQMLATTEGNLKRISGQQLNATQQDSVSQIRQFADQARAALDAGDMERAQTLAWKAELLSEDLLKPQK